MTLRTKRIQGSVFLRLPIVKIKYKYISLCIICLGITGIIRYFFYIPNFYEILIVFIESIFSNFDNSAGIEYFVD